MSLHLTPEQMDSFSQLSHLPELIARKIMGRRLHCHSELEDAAQEGLMALAKAIRDYQPERGLSLEQFASHRVRTRIIDVHRSRFGRHRGTERFRFESSVVSIDGAAGTKVGDQTMSKTMPDPKSEADIKRSEAQDEIEHMFRGLTALQAKVLNYYYCQEMKVEEIAVRIGKCPARAFQIICRAVDYLRRRSRTYEHVEGISRHTSAPVRMYRPLGVQLGDGAVLTLRQYADESGIKLKRVHKLAASGRLNTAPIEEYGHVAHGTVCGDLDGDNGVVGLREQDAEQERCVAA